MALTKTNLANIVEGILPVANGGTGTSTGVSPGGSTTQVQYNNAGAFAGSANFIYDTNGQLSIGSSSPVLPGGSPSTRGEVSINGSTDAFVALGIGGVIKGYIGQTSNGLQLDSEGATTITAVTNGAERMRIDSSGNVGIGTSSPGAKLQVNGDMRADNFYCTTNDVSSFGTLSSSTSFTIRGSAAGVPNIAQVYTNNVERLRITSAGGVSFGNTGSAYGSSGQVLTSNGDAPPTWVTPTSVSSSQLAKAWVNWNSGAGIRASYNVSSVSKNGTGLWTVNFSSSLADGNYAVAAGGGDYAGGDLIAVGVFSAGNQTASSCQVVSGLTGGSGGRRDSNVMCITCFR